jgi:hypothetical protein
VPFSSNFHRVAGIANEAKPSQPTTAIRIIIPPAASSSENTEASEVCAFLFLCAADFIETHSFTRRKRLAIRFDSWQKTQQIACSSGFRTEDQTKIHQEIQQVEDSLSKQPAPRGEFFASSESRWRYSADRHSL